MEDRKTMEFDWEFGHTELVLEVTAYEYGKRLAVLLYEKEDGYWVPFGDLTKNLVHCPAEINEAYISDLSSTAKLKLIRKYGLGKPLSDRGTSGYCSYAKVAFNLDRLAEYDPEGVAKYRELHGIQKDGTEMSKKETEKAMKKRTEQER